MTTATLPLDTHELIDMIDEMFPPQCIQPNQTIESAHRYAGKRELIDYLIKLQAKTAKRQLRDNLLGE